MSDFFVPVPEVIGPLPDHGIGPREPLTLVDPEPGQVWRVVGARGAAPVVLAHVRPDTVIVWAIGEDTDQADAGTVIVSSGEPLGRPFGVWATVERQFPRTALEGSYGALPPVDFARLRDVEWQIRVGRPMGDGAPFTSVLDPRVAYRDAISEWLREVAVGPDAPDSDH